MLLSLLSVTGGAGEAREGRVRTSDGRTFNGAVAFEAEGVAVKPGDGDAVKVSIEELAELTFPDLPDVPTPAKDSGAANASPSVAPGPGWSPAQVGSGTAGTLAEDGGPTGDDGSFLV